MLKILAIILLDMHFTWVPLVNVYIISTGCVEKFNQYTSVVSRVDFDYVLLVALTMKSGGKGFLLLKCFVMIIRTYTKSHAVIL